MCLSPCISAFPTSESASAATRSVRQPPPITHRTFSSSAPPSPSMSRRLRLFLPATLGTLQPHPPRQRRNRRHLLCAAPPPDPATPPPPRRPDEEADCVAPKSMVAKSAAPLIFLDLELGPAHSVAGAGRRPWWKFTLPLTFTRETTSRPLVIL
jgi:hypothetical protein